MAAIRFYLKGFLILAVLILVPQFSMAGNQPETPILKVQKSFQCMSEFKNSIYKNLKSPPVFKSPSQAVAWIRERLPKKFGEMFDNAGNDLVVIAGPENINRLAKSRKLFYRVLSTVTFRNLFVSPTEGPPICGGNISILMAGTLWDYLEINHEVSVISDIRNLTGDDPSMESRVFVLLFTLDATGKPWKLSWMSEALKAQNELEKFLSSPNER